MKTLTALDRAAQVDGLPPDRRKRLQEHVARLTADADERIEIEARVVRCAALLLRSGRGGHVAVPVAVAQAQAVERFPGIGPAIRAILESLLTLESEDLDRLSANRTAVQTTLLECSRELAGLAARLEPGVVGRSGTA
jgi:hypothetical protein